MRAAGAEKMEYFITFPASALVWKALLGASSTVRAPSSTVPVPGNYSVTEDKPGQRAPPPRRKFSARGRTLAPPTPTNSLLCQARKKWSTSSLFQPPHWSGRRFWARHRCTLGANSRLGGPSPGPQPGGEPPFGLVFGINWQQSSHKLEPPLGRACLCVWQNEDVLEKLCASATRGFFSGAKVAVLEPK